MSNTSNLLSMLNAIWNGDFSKISQLVDEGFDVNTEGIFPAIFTKKIAPAIRLFLENPNFDVINVIYDIVASAVDEEIIDPQMLNLVLSYETVRQTLNEELLEGGPTQFGHYLVNNSDLNVVEIFLQNGANPNLGAESALHFACVKETPSPAALRKKVELIKLLLRYGGDLNAISADGILSLYGLIFSKSAQLSLKYEQLVKPQVLEYIKILTDFYDYLQPYINKYGVFFTSNHITVDQTIKFYKTFCLKINRMMSLKDLTLEYYSETYYDYLTSSLGEISFDDKKIRDIASAISNVATKEEWNHILELNIPRVYLLLKKHFEVNRYNMEVNIGKIDKKVIQNIMTFGLLSQDFFINYTYEYVSFLQNLSDRYNNSEWINADNFIIMCQKIALMKSIIVISGVKLKRQSFVELQLTNQSFIELFKNNTPTFYRIINGERHVVTVATSKQFIDSLEEAISLKVKHIPVSMV